MSDKPSDIIITITISPAVNGKRKVLISGAPEKEMPVVRAGVFADVHRLFDEVWVTLMKREPQVVTVKEEKMPSKKMPAAKQVYKDGKLIEDNSAKFEGKTDEKIEEIDDEEDERDQAPDPVEHAIDELTPPNADSPDESEELPVIEGDSSTPLRSAQNDEVTNE